ncbi:MAG: bifunctional hydroxymethylpyrimidine kinase/phosphomethylpyrimidine kinase [Candidatus Binataceae bacterium]
MLVALTIAGSDSSGGAGIQADLKTFGAFGVYGASVITALTAQNTRGVRAIADLDPGFVAAEIDAVAEDLPVAAVKTGMLARGEIIETVAARLRVHRIAQVVVDPVMVAASGDILLEPAAIGAMRGLIMPLATIITPNLREAAILAGFEVKGPDTMREAARALVRMGVRAALVKGGGLVSGDALDVFYDGVTMRELRTPRVRLERAHGAGCTLSAAIAAVLALGGSLEEAVTAAKRYVTRALETAPRLGHGATPLNHMVKVEPVSSMDATAAPASSRGTTGGWR